MDPLGPAGTPAWYVNKQDTYNPQSPGTSPRDIPASLALLQAIVLTSPSYPTFEREAVHPIMGKMSVTLLKVIERLITDPERDYPVLVRGRRSLRSANCSRHFLCRWSAPS